MISIPLQISAPRIPRLNERIRFTPAQVQRMADTVHATQLDRVARSVDANDQPMKALTPRYAERKRRKGLPPVRDMRFTGNMLRGMTAYNVSEGGFTVGYAHAHPKARRAAYFRELFDGFLGMSPTDLGTLDDTLEGIYAEVLIDIWEDSAA